tara:strand:- start:762 stop:983 length:222 start_codon:yes stop_codon:yes gene_type:complete
MKMVNKDLLLKGISTMLYSFPFFFGGPMLLFYSVQQDSLLLKIVAGILMLMAMFLGGKGLMMIVESFFGKRKK